MRGIDEMNRDVVVNKIANMGQVLSILHSVRSFHHFVQEKHVAERKRDLQSHSKTFFSVTGRCKQLDSKPRGFTLAAGELPSPTVASLLL